MWQREVSFIWPDGHNKMLTLTGTKRDQVRSLQATATAVEMYTANHMREA